MVVNFFRQLILIISSIILISQSLWANSKPSEASVISNMPDSIQHLESAYTLCMNNGDTVKAINFLLALGDAYSHRAQYSQAYEYFWNALALADRIQDTMLIANVHAGIGWLYSFYERRDEALHHFNLSITYKKKLIAQKHISNEQLVSDYYSITTLFRELEEYQLSKNYLDSCYIIYHTVDDKHGILPYLEAERAYYHIHIGDFKNAVKILGNIKPWFSSNEPSYLVVLNTFYADAYKGMLLYDNSEELYKQALAWAVEYTRHVNYVPLIHKRLADLYFVTGNYKTAFNSLNNAKAKTEELFDSRSLNNRPLLEITDEFRREKEEKRILLQSQQLTRLEHEKRIRVLQNIILLGVLLLFVMLTFLYLRYIKLKQRTKDALYLKQQELEQQNTQELIQLKNRELASSALRLIEKDKFVNEVKEKVLGITSMDDITDVKRFIKTSSINNDQNWKEFEARFVEVNGEFYKMLKHYHPGLTSGDLKICALIKLNFNSKEIAGLLGIGIESVHTIRYRLRRKLGLTRKDNLTEYIFNVESSQTQ